MLEKFNISKKLYWLFGIILLNVLGSNCEQIVTEQPSYLKPCQIYKPNFTPCSTESIQGFMDALTNNEIPEIKAEIGTFDPMNVGKLKFQQDNNQAVSLDADLDNVVVRGFSKLVIKESRVSKKDFSWQTKIYVPLLQIRGKYKMNGRILLIPLNGAGNMEIDIENMDIIMHTKTRLHEKQGFTFYNVTNVRINFKVSKVHTNFENIFNGNSKDVERSTNAFFNENWQDFFEALRPLITDTIEKVLYRVLKTSFDIIPANFFVEDIPTSEKLYGKKNNK